MSFKKYGYLISVVLVILVLLAVYELLKPKTAVAPKTPSLENEAMEVAKREPDLPTQALLEQRGQEVLEENSIQILGHKTEVELDDLLSLGWNFSGLPAKAGLVLSLVRDVPAADRFKYNGATGPVTLQPIAVSNGTGSTTWKVNQVGCAPTDFPTWCEVQPGTYYLEGTVYDQSDFSILGMFRPQEPAPKVLIKHRTDSFKINGIVDLQVLERELEGAALNLMVAEFNLDQGGGIFSAQSYMGIEGSWFDAGVQKCLNFTFKAPFSGKVRACGNPLKRGEVAAEVVQPLLIDTTVKEYSLAKELAESQATQPYLNRVAFRTQPTPEAAGYPGYNVIDFQTWSDQNPEATTYLSSTLRDWKVKDKNWLFAYDVGKAGGSAQGSDRFNDLVWVKVPPQGLACIVAAGPRRSVEFDYQTDSLNCL